MLEQEETQGYSECEVADEPVVVMKFRPVKAGNRLEDKTGTMASGGFASHNTSKVCDGCEVTHNSYREGRAIVIGTQVDCPRANTLGEQHEQTTMHRKRNRRDNDSKTAG